MKGMRFFTNLVNAIPLPDFDRSLSKWKVHEAEKALESVVESLKQGDHVLLYPSGHLKSSGVEKIGANSFVSKILAACPDINVVLVRTTGLWGSLFSCAPTGRSPEFWPTIRDGVKILLKNAIFFCPRRSLEIEFSMNPEGLPRHGKKQELNTFLEDWYNRYPLSDGRVVDSEPLQLVSHSFLFKKYPEIYDPGEEAFDQEDLDVPPEMRETIYQELARVSHKKGEEISDDHELARDLGLDSLDLAGIETFLDERYAVKGSRDMPITFVKDLYRLVLMKEDDQEASKQLPREVEYWPEESSRPDPSLPVGKTMQEAFLASVERMGKHTACRDASTGTLSYCRLELGVMVLARKFRKCPGRYIGVLLPSSIGSYMTILATLFAGKIPVVLNWTTGVRNLNHAKSLLGIDVVITARRFLQKAAEIDLGELASSLLLLEDIKRETTLFDLLRSIVMPPLKPRAKPSDVAVVLFTSGTETLPKAVPLTHQNLLANQRMVLEVVHPSKDEVIYGVLPPFHSFGYNMTGLLPLLAGIKVFYAPDPTDTWGMVSDIVRFRPTLLCAAPSFYRNIFRVAGKKELDSVRLFISGAEKAPESLFKFIEGLGDGKHLVEGYGITECSPAVTIGRLDEPRNGVGKPLSGVELCVIHPDTKEKLSQGEVGEICISGETVFEGYLGQDVPHPFIEIEGKTWYRSGDLGHIDPDGSLILGGRLNRFVKIGGEMVSLVSVEEVLTAFGKEHGWIPKGEETPQLAVGALEKNQEKPLLILFTTFSITKDEVNGALHSSGFGRIIKVSDVHQIPEIPMTGTGKVQLRKISEWIKEKYA